MLLQPNLMPSRQGSATDDICRSRSCSSYKDSLPRTRRDPQRIYCRDPSNPTLNSKSDDGNVFIIKDYKIKSSYTQDSLTRSNVSIWTIYLPLVFSILYCMCIFKSPQQHCLSIVTNCTHYFCENRIALFIQLSIIFFCHNFQIHLKI